MKTPERRQCNYNHLYSVLGPKWATFESNSLKFADDVSFVKQPVTSSLPQNAPTFKRMHHY